MSLSKILVYFWLMEVPFRQEYFYKVSEIILFFDLLLCYILNCSCVWIMIGIGRAVSKVIYIFSLFPSNINLRLVTVFYPPYHI